MGESLSIQMVKSERRSGDERADKEYGRQESLGTRQSLRPNKYGSHHGKCVQRNSEPAINAAEKMREGRTER